MSSNFAESVLSLEAEDQQRRVVSTSVFHPTLHSKLGCRNWAAAICAATTWHRNSDAQGSSHI